MEKRIANVFNTLFQISTKGQDTLLMASCLNELKAIVEDIVKEKNMTESIETESAM